MPGPTSPYLRRPIRPLALVLYMRSRSRPEIGRSPEGVAEPLMGEIVQERPGVTNDGGGRLRRTIERPL
jgi:hypothetical protein